MKKIILTVILGIVMLGIISLYLWGILFDGKSYSEDLSKCALLLIATAVSLVRIHTNQRKVPLSVYEKHFADDIKGAFSTDSPSRKKLLTALKLYCENNPNKSLKYLFSLKDKCKTYEDRKAVSFFIALVFSDAGYIEDAIDAYIYHLEESPRHSTALSNLGLLYARIGDNDSAEACYLKAIDANPDNAHVYINLSSLYRSEYELDKAEEYAKKALQLKPDLYQAATQLACIYAAKGNAEERKKYYQIAIANGENAEALKILIDRILLGDDPEEDYEE